LLKAKEIFTFALADELEEIPQVAPKRDRPRA
jgi:hypothetical protein